MFSQIKKLFIPPTFDDEDKTRVSQLLYTNAVALITLGIGLALYYTASEPGSPDVPGYWLLVGILGAVSLGGVWLVRRGRVRAASVVFLTLVTLLFGAQVYSYGGVISPEYSRFIMVTMMAALFLGARATFPAAALASLFGLGLALADIRGLLPHYDMSLYKPLDVWVSRTLDYLVTALLMYVASRSLNQTIERTRRNEHALAEANQRLEKSQADLALRSRDLERRSAYLEAAAQISRLATSSLEVEALLQQLADIIQDRFKLYHVGLFLPDESGRRMVYRAGSGHMSHALLEQSFTLEIDNTSLVGWCAANRQLHTVNDVHANERYRSHPLVPDTCSEADLPRVTNERMLGVLTAQSDQVNYFDRDLLAALQAISDSIAAAINNAQLFHQAQASLEAERLARGEISRAAWAALQKTRSALGYRYTDGRVESMSHVQRPEIDRALSSQSYAVEVGADSQQAACAIPIKVRGATIGVVDIRREMAQPWSEEELATMQTLADQLATALESARLYQDTQRRAARERTLREIADQMQRAPDLESLMRIAAEELKQTLGGSRAYVRLGTESRLRPSDGNGQPGEGGN